MKVALDSNLLVYAALVWKTAEDELKTARLDPIFAILAERTEMVVPFQVLGECYQVMSRHGYSRERCRRIIADWMDQFETAGGGSLTFERAVDLATDHKLQFWDALILSTAADAGCTLLLSEDMQPGFVWRGVTVANPFADPLDRTLERVMRD